MNSQKKYDVFISSKSEDYPIAREIYTFLEGRGYRVFFAEKSIPLGADSVFKKTIDNALDAAQNMIVVGSDATYLSEGWVHYEWNTFAVEILSGRKSKSNILTVLNDTVSTNDIPIGLRSCQNLPISSYKDTICEYLGRPHLAEDNQLATASTPSSEDIKRPTIANKRRMFVWLGLSLIAMIGLGVAVSFTIFAKTKTTVQQANISQTDLDFTVGEVSFKMVSVEGGTFTMGATAEQGTEATSDELPVRSVTLSNYYIGETEVTQALWQAVMGSNPSDFSGENHPVDNVTWEDCQIFIQKLNHLTNQEFRLPTEAEWEFAARGGNKSAGYKYAGSDRLEDVAWYQDNCGNTTHPVKLLQANELGLYDMSGNVYEWCQDWYGAYESGAYADPIGVASGNYRLLRGGSWYNYAWRCRVSYRRSCAPTVAFYNVGLRLAM